MNKHHSVLVGLVVGVSTALLSSGIPVRALNLHSNEPAASHESAALSNAATSTALVDTAAARLLPAASTMVSPRDLASVTAVDGRLLESARVIASASHSVPDMWPVAGRISSIYTPHRMHPILGRYAPHYGLDLAAPYGTPIHATADGVVAAVVNSRSYGLGVDIDHGNGYITRYAHASRLVVQKGMRVRQGDVIAYVGSTGLSTGPHCHYEVFHDGWSVDPASLLMRR